MVQEVKVQSSNFAAEYGAGGMSVSAVTKAGSRRSSTAASTTTSATASSRPTTARTRLPGVEKPKSKYQYPGLNVGGPISSPASTSSATSVLLRRLRSAAPAGRLGLALRRRADAQAARGRLLGVRDEQRQQPRTAGRQRADPGGFAGRRHSRLRATTSRRTSTPHGKVLANLYPVPNTGRSGQPVQLRLQPLEPTNRNDLKMRFDYNISQQHQGLRPRRRRGRGRRERAAACGGARRTSRCRRRTSARTRAGRCRGNIVTVLSPTMTNEALVSLEPPEAGQHVQGSRRRCAVDSYGLSMHRPVPGRRARTFPASSRTGAAASATCGRLGERHVCAQRRADVLGQGDEDRRRARPEVRRLGLAPAEAAELPEQRRRLPGVRARLVVGHDGQRGRRHADGPHHAVPVRARKSPDGEFRMWNYRLLRAGLVEGEVRTSRSSTASAPATGRTTSS